MCKWILRKVMLCQQSIIPLLNSDFEIFALRLPNHKETVELTSMKKKKKNTAQIQLFRRIVRSIYLGKIKNRRNVFTVIGEIF